MKSCPFCGYQALGADSADVGQDDLLREIQILRAHCSNRRITTVPPDWVRSADAASLVGWAPKTMQNRMAEDQPFTPHKLGGRVYISLREIAGFRLKNRN